jgi:hypothetical protein
MGNGTFYAIDEANIPYVPNMQEALELNGTNDAVVFNPAKARVWLQQLIDNKFVKMLEDANARATLGAGGKTPAEIQSAYTTLTTNIQTLTNPQVFSDIYTQLAEGTYFDTNNYGDLNP